LQNDQKMVSNCYLPFGTGFGKINTTNKALRSLKLRTLLLFIVYCEVKHFAERVNNCYLPFGIGFGEIDGSFVIEAYCIFSIAYSYLGTRYKRAPAGDLKNSRSIFHFFEYQFRDFIPVINMVFPCTYVP